MSLDTETKQSLALQDIRRFSSMLKITDYNPISALHDFLATNHTFSKRETGHHLPFRSKFAKMRGSDFSSKRVNVCHVKSCALRFVPSFTPVGQAGHSSLPNQLFNGHKLCDLSLIRSFDHKHSLEDYREKKYKGMSSLSGVQARGNSQIQNTKVALQLIRY